jgi:hypothetical protein
MNKVVCLFAFKSDLIKDGIVERKEDSRYINSAIENIMLYKTYSVDIVIFTDSPNDFKDLDINVIPYFEINKSYTDKLLVCELALKKYDTVLYIDSDITIDISMFCEIDFEPGFHYAEEWVEGVTTYGELKKDLKGEYFKHIENYCKENRITIDDARLIGERFFIISKNDKIDEFFLIFNHLKKETNQNDLILNNKPIGRGEGLIIGLSLLKSQMSLHKTNHLRQINNDTIY